MLAREMLQKEFAYNAWANGRILDQAELVSEEQWTAKSAVEGRSLQEILAHLFAVERMWRLLCAHGILEEEDYIPPDQLKTVEDMRELSEIESEYVAVLLQDWSDEAFSEVETVTRWDGKQIPLVRWHMLRHLLTHSMQHRSEAAVVLTEHGRSPGDLDFIFFV